MSISAYLKNTVKSSLLRRLQRIAAKTQELTTNGSVMILAPHPDDEVFGCAGLISRLVSEGRPPYIVIFTGGGGSHRGCCDTAEQEICDNRRRLAAKALASLGVPSDHISFLDFKDGSIADRPNDQMQKLDQLIADVKPASIFFPHSGEGWPDHLAVRLIGIEEALKHNIPTYEYCVWMWFYVQRNLNWPTARTIHLSDQEHTAKLEAIDIYSSALAPCGRPWIGVLPPLFMKANSSRTELYFKL